MRYRAINDPSRLQALIGSIIEIEADAELSQLLTTLVEQACELVGARYGALGVLSADGESLDEFVTTGIDRSTYDEIGELPVGRGVLGRVIKSHDALRIDDLAHADGGVGFPKGHPPMTTMLGVPVRLEGGEVFGNLYLCDKVDGTVFSQADEDLVATLGLAAGQLIDTARLRSQLRRLTLSDERARIGRDLHDTVIQRLFAVGLSLQRLSNAGLPQEAQERIERAVEDLDDTIREIRSTIFAITSQGSDDGGSMRHQILELANEIDGRLGLDVYVSFRGPVDAVIRGEIANSIKNAARESLTNVVRHAHASRAEVKLFVIGDRIELSVIDNGVGISREGIGGNGLRNLEERASALGGSCSVHLLDGGGTHVLWWIKRPEEKS